MEIVGTDERVRGIPGVRDRRVQPTKVRLYVVGTQNHHLIEMVLLSTENKCLNRQIRKKSKFYAEIFCLTGPTDKTITYHIND